MWHIMTHDMTWHDTDDIDYMMTWKCQFILATSFYVYYWEWSSIHLHMAYKWGVFSVIRTWGVIAKWCPFSFSWSICCYLGKNMFSVVKRVKKSRQFCIHLLSLKGTHNLNRTLSIGNFSEHTLQWYLEVQKWAPRSKVMFLWSSKIKASRKERMSGVRYQRPHIDGLVTWHIGASHVRGAIFKIDNWRSQQLGISVIDKHTS